jgi:HEPN domain-containing protein
LKHLAASDAGIYPRFDVLRQLFAQLSQEHAIPPDSVEQASFALTG